MRRLLTYRTLRAIAARLGVDIGEAEHWRAFYRAAVENVRPG